MVAPTDCGYGTCSQSTSIRGSIASSNSPVCEDKQLGEEALPPDVERHAEEGACGEVSQHGEAQTQDHQDERCDDNDFVRPNGAKREAITRA